MKFHEDGRAQRLLDLFPQINGQINVSYVNSIKHAVAWHRHNKQVDYWCCLKGSFKVGLTYGTKVWWEYLSDKNFRILEIRPPLWHGYRALEPGSIMLYYLTEKYDTNDEDKCLPGSFGENWSIVSK